MNTSTDTSRPSTHTPGNAAASATARPRALLADANVRWLVAGGAVTLVGDQLTLIALPWLALQLSSDPLVLGTVLAVIGVPRALFILIGGAFVDRHTPKNVLMVTKFASAALLAVLAVAVAAGMLTLPLLYLLALGLGLASAFAIPASSSILPQVVPPSQLAAINALFMSVRQASAFVGPLLAGLLIVVGGSGMSWGLAVAFGLDAFSFLFSAWTLAHVATRTLPQPPRQAVLAAVAEGLRTFWADRELRTLLGYGAAVGLMIAGPLQTALPVLAHSVPTLGAGALGTMAGAHGAGLLVGLAIAGWRPHWRLRSLGVTILAIDAAVGLLLLPMGSVTAAWQGAALLMCIGVLGGYMQVIVFTWLQRRVAPPMMGRAMSVFMFVFVGLAPLSAAATGALLRGVPLTAVFAGAGGLLIAIVAFALLGSRMRRLADVEPGR